MQSINIDQTSATWSSLADKIFVPHSEQDYNRLVSLLDILIDRIGEDESHPLASMMDVIGVLIESYESKYVPNLEEVA